MVVRAAVSGIGIARLPKIMIEDELERGMLVQVFEDSEPERLGKERCFISCRATPVERRMSILLSWLDKVCSQGAA